MGLKRKTLFDSNNYMEIIADLLKITIPAVIVLYGMFLSVKSLLKNDYDKKLIELQGKKMQITLPLRLQAYERMALFLERITPNNLITRLNDNSYTNEEMRIVLINEIRNEFNHNFSQQVYISSEAWEYIRTATERVISAINDASSGTEPTGQSMALIKRVFEGVINANDDYTSAALEVLKKEIKALF